jgi:hypothetical protein
MLTEVKIEDMAEQVRQLMQIKYADPSAKPVLAKLLGRKGRKVVVMRIDRFAPLVIDLRNDAYAVRVGGVDRFDLRITIPLRDMMGLFMGKLPIKSLLRGKVRFLGMPTDGLLLQKFLYIDVGDPRSAFEYIRHYYLDD